MTDNNIQRCKTCGSPLIAEELPTHKCFKFKDLWVIDGKMWVGDGARYYPYNHSTLNTQKETRKDGTECLIGFCFLIACCKTSVEN